MKADGAAIKTLRTHKNISLRTLEKLTSLDDTYLSRVERGQREPGDDALKAIAAALKVDVAAITLATGADMDVHAVNVGAEDTGADADAEVVADIEQQAAVVLREDPPVSLHGVSVPSETAALINAVACEFAQQFASAMAGHLNALLSQANSVPSHLRLYTPEQVAEAWGVSETWVKNHLFDRRMPGTKPGHHMRMSEADLAEVIRAGQVGPRGRQLPHAS